MLQVWLNNHEDTERRVAVQVMTQFRPKGGTVFGP